MKNALLFSLSLFISFALIEGSFRLKEKHLDQQWYVYQPNQTYDFEPDSNLFVGIKGQKKFHTNRSGYRAKSNFEKQTYNWLCVGGSTTECNYLDDDETWYGLLEKKLGGNFRFASVGKSGHTSKDHYYYLKNILKKDKKVKGVILMCGLNDLVKYLANPKFDLAIYEKDSLLHFEQTGRINEDGFISHSAFLFWAKENIFSKQEKINKIDRTGAILKRWRANFQSKKMTLDSLPTMSKAVEEFSQNISKIISLCKEKNIELIVQSQSAIWKEKLTLYEQNIVWMGGVGDYQNQKGGAYYSPKALSDGLGLFNLTTKENCIKQNIKFIELNLPKDTTVFYDDCHFNELGATKIAGILYKEMSQKTQN